MLLILLEKAWYGEVYEVGCSQSREFWEEREGWARDSSALSFSIPSCSCGGSLRLAAFSFDGHNDDEMVMVMMVMIMMVVMVRLIMVMMIRTIDIHSDLTLFL